MSRRSPVVTGIGILCAAGCGSRRVWEAIRDGRSGLGPLTLFSSPRFGHHLVGQVREDVDALAGKVRGSRSDKLAWIAAREALSSAGLNPAEVSNSSGLSPQRIGVIFGSTVGGMRGTEQFLHQLLREKRHRFGSLRFHECASSTDLCARMVQAQGPCTTISTACSAGAMAIAAAAELIEQGAADLVLTGGSDSLCRLTLNGFGSLLLLDPKGCRPFDAGRTGISLGEGAGMLVLESEETAHARGATILARLSGWGASCDAFHATAPQPEGRGALAAMRQALERSGLEPARIDYVSAHGTGTPDNDAMEAKALRQLFGDQVPPFASVKRFFGHTLAASGAIKAVICVQALREQAVPPNLGMETLDPGLGMERSVSLPRRLPGGGPVTEFRSQSLTHILSNSFGFGGNNAALVFSRADAARPGISQSGVVPTVVGEKNTLVEHGQVPWPDCGRFAILEYGAASAAGSTLAEIQDTFRQGGAMPTQFEMPAALSAGTVSVLACKPFGADALIEPAKRRRLGRLQQMAVAAARRCWAAAGVTNARAGVAFGTGLGSLNDTAAFVENLVINDERAPRPAFFTNSVHNSLASQIALELELTGLNSTMVQREISFEAALWHGSRELATQHADLMLIGAADELNAYHLATGQRWGNKSEPAVYPGEGCTVFALARNPGNQPPIAWVNGIRLGRVNALAGQPIDACAEADWIIETLAQNGETLDRVDLLVTGFNGNHQLKPFYYAVAAALARRAGRPIPCGAYQHACGEFPAASAFGFLTAIGLVRGEIAPALCLADFPATAVPQSPCRTVLLYTLSPSGTKAMCCVQAG
ncbi:MAG: beta-ketoacyl-[acyl-carrier-protein] synthase family protein [Verrucomicrobiota bacterium]